MKYIYMLSPNKEPQLFGAIRKLIVVAESEEQARNTHPGLGWEVPLEFPLWVNSPKDVQVQKLGIADSEIPTGIVLVSLSNSWIDDGR